jgi:hypothetical protein
MLHLDFSGNSHKQLIFWYDRQMRTRFNDLQLFNISGMNESEIARPGNSFLFQKHFLPAGG